MNGMNWPMRIQAKTMGNLSHFFISLTDMPRTVAVLRTYTDILRFEADILRYIIFIRVRDRNKINYIGARRILCRGIGEIYRKNWKMYSDSPPPPRTRNSAGANELNFL